MMNSIVMTASYGSNNNYGKLSEINRAAYLVTPSNNARLFKFIAITMRRPSVFGTSCIKIPGNMTNIFGLGLIASLPPKIIGALLSSTSIYTTQLNSEGK
mgnify:CR=1 FL=1